MRPNPEEQARLKTEKEAKKAVKKAKFGVQNAEQNMPVCEIRVPWRWYDEPLNGRLAGKEIDIETPMWQQYIESAEYHYRMDCCYTKYGYFSELMYTGPLKRRIIRT